MENKRLEYIGKLCAEYRKEYLKLKQSDVAVDVGCSKENIAAFEQGRNNSARILLWYIGKGLTINGGGCYE